jgi:hypothetical protein
MFFGMSLKGCGGEESATDHMSKHGLFVVWTPHPSLLKRRKAHHVCLTRDRKFDSWMALGGFFSLLRLLSLHEIPRENGRNKPQREHMDQQSVPKIVWLLENTTFWILRSFPSQNVHSLFIHDYNTPIRIRWQNLLWYTYVMTCTWDFEGGESSFFYPGISR